MFYAFTTYVYIHQLYIVLFNMYYRAEGMAQAVESLLKKKKKEQ
jgi:hypothetical protein